MGPATSPLTRRLWAAGILAGVGAALVLVVLVLKFGRYDPSPPSLEKNPNPAIPGEIIFLDGDGCIVRAPASGESRSRVHCPGQGVYGLSWVDRDTIAFVDTYKSGPPAWIEYDLATGEKRDTGITAEFSGPVRGGESPQGEQVVIEEDGDVILVAGTERTKIAQFEVPRYNQPILVTWSPDGAWLLLGYWARRDETWELWILGKDGKTKGTLTRSGNAWGSSAASWWIDGFGYLPEVRGLPAGR